MRVARSAKFNIHGKEKRLRKAWCTDSISNTMRSNYLALGSSYP